MKKLLLFCSALFIGATLAAQTTATNFTCNDCNSVSHTLFSELDAGKVIVMCWVMPCATCIPPASADAAAVQSFASSYPGRVKFYLVDDVGNTSCSTLTGWASTNGITTDAAFGNSGTPIKMTDYGTSGMPKTVVLGGPNHTIFYNVNGTVSSSALQTAITNALNASTGISEAGNISSFNVFPNPTGNSTEISYSLQSSSDVKAELFNLVGEKLKSVSSGNQSAGVHKITIDCTDITNGIYFVKLIANRTEQTITLSVSH
ncbi:MAG: T9SS type A sorting domain-containing protein [Bacteroidetes bacterium]|nr:T9SS type A sorting domain-containing protein [Bacteroidota bacterium]